MSRPGPARRWRPWQLGGAAGVVALVLIVFGLSQLPEAPQVPSSKPIPDTARGKLVEKLETLSYPTAEVGWAIATKGPYWEVLRSTDGGDRWKDVNPAGNASNGGIALTAVSASTAAVVFLAYQYIRYSTFAVTTDGGASWHAGVLPNAGSAGPDPIYPLGSGQLVAVLGSGAVVRSRNGGTTWTTVSLPAPPEGSCLATSVWFSSRGSGWVTGECRGVAAAWHSADGGSSWQLEVFADDYPGGEAIEVLPPLAGPSGRARIPVLLSHGSTQRLLLFSQSASGGWSSPTALSLPAGRALVSFPSTSTGWVLVAPSTAGALALLFYTSNGGANWSLRTTPIAAGQVTGLSLTLPGRGRALAQAGAQQLLWSTNDGGTNWSSAPLQVFQGAPPKVNGVRP